MREMFDCGLNGESLLLLDNRLYIQDIREEVKHTAETWNRPLGGKRLGLLSRDGLDIVIPFMVKERDRIKRQEIISRVNAWAESGWLTVSTRPGKRIYACCTKKAVSVSFAWHEEMSLTFTAFGEACWQDELPVTASASGASGSAAIRPRGTRPCPLEASFTPTGGALTSASVTCGGKTIAFEGLSVAKGKTLKIFMDEYGVLQASNDGSPALAYRTAASADAILLTPGTENTVTFAASRSCSVTLEARGRYE